MSYRDDHAAAVMRAEAGDREVAQLTAENERLARELAEAKMWLGGPRKRMVLATVGLLGGVGLVLGGVMCGRASVEVPEGAAAEVKAEPLPAIAGVIVADGPKVGHWTLTATRCAPRDDGVQLTAVGSEDHGIWLTNHQVEVELPDGIVALRKGDCSRRFAHAITRHDDRPPRYEGHVELDCQFDGNRVQGRIDFKHCR